MKSFKLISSRFIGWMAAVILSQAVAVSAVAVQPAGQGTHASIAAPNSLALAIKNVGIKQCASSLTALSALGIQGAVNNDVLLDWDRSRPANSAVFALLALDTPVGGAAMTVNAVSEADGSCSVSAERISVAPAACEAVAAQELAGYRATPLLNRITVYTDHNDPGSSVSLFAVKEGCLVIRRFARFNVRNN
ncbi:hypothetical protein AB4Y32_08270 [Paraburkholderia phymatum]|uniref:Uncharacterized protein n=1 Tax=Paraburkholderia phymatum TaxID=148447 RepID=A0ACC6TWZ4_9BURK